MTVLEPETLHEGDASDSEEDAEEIPNPFSDDSRLEEKGRKRAPDVFTLEEMLRKTRAKTTLEERMRIGKEQGLLAAGVSGVKKGAVVAVDVCIDEATEKTASDALLSAGCEAAAEAVEAGGGLTTGIAGFAGKFVGERTAEYAARKAGCGKVGQARSSVGGGVGGAMSASAMAGYVVAGPPGAAGAVAMTGMGAVAGKVLQHGAHKVRLSVGWTAEPYFLSVDLRIGENITSTGDVELSDLGVSWIKLRRSKSPLFDYALTIQTFEQVHIEFQDSDGHTHAMICQLPRKHSKRFNAENPTITTVVITQLGH